ncbi:MAG: acetyl-CoA carboxylase carboxyltransferase subunit beta [Alphaproteobacteria bacterium]|nr:acetyl-CoA carboxylase carboxyltransferase subunit beta [Alphaproteobacteria bacterium]
MSWLTTLIRPKISDNAVKSEVPDNLWHKCSSCSNMIFHKDLTANLLVCHHCQHHMRIGAEERFTLLFDEGQWNKVELPKVWADPLKFKDKKRYADRLRETRNSKKLQEAIQVAVGKIGGITCVIAAFDFDFMGGSMGMAVGEGLLTAARQALAHNAALIAIPASGGARMQEGILSLMQMPRTTIAVQQVREAHLPYIVILTDPTTGGVSASFAMLGDVTIAEPNALICFAGPRVIEETIREKLPEGFQRSEYLLEHGMVDMVVHRKDLRARLTTVLQLIMLPNPNPQMKKRA